MDLGDLQWSRSLFSDFFQEFGKGFVLFFLQSFT